MALKFTQQAAEAYKYLNGVFCIFKPAGLSLRRIRPTLLFNICRDLNEMELREPSKYVVIEGNTAEKLNVTVRENYADHVLAAGPRYIPDDFKLRWTSHLGKMTSGIVLVGINDGTRLAHKLFMLRPVRTYHIKGQFGILSDNLFIDGKIIEKASFKHVNKGMLDRNLSVIQAAHQRLIYAQAGFDIRTQEAYELAAQGPIRPADGKVPIIYSVKCIHFNPPDYAIEVMCINEYENYLINLNNEIGQKLRTVSTCTAIQCIRHSFFTIEDALLRKHWTLQHILNNIDYCSQIADKHKDLINNITAVIQKT